MVAQTLIVNPVATRTNGSVAREVRHILSGLGAVHVYETQNTRDAYAYLRSLDQQPDLVTVLGGDGTVNEVVDAVVARCSQPPTIAALPGGFANIMSRGTGLGTDPRSAAMRVVDGFTRGSVVDVPVGKVDDRIFLSSCAVGLPARVVETAGQRGVGKRPVSALSWVRSGIASYARALLPHADTFDVEIGGATRGRQKLLVVQLQWPLTFLAGRPLSLTGSGPAHSGSAFQVFSMGRLDPLAVGANAVRLFAPHLPVPPVGAHLQRTAGPVAFVSPSQPVPVQVDGELIASRDQALVSQPLRDVPFVVSHR